MSIESCYHAQHEALCLDYSRGYYVDRWDEFKEAIKQLGIRYAL